MKHIIVVVLAGLSLLVAVPLSQPKPVAAHKSTIKHVVHVKQASAVVASATPTPAVVQPVPQISYTVGGGCRQYRHEFEKYGWNVDVAMAIMQAESTCVSDAVSPLNYDGLNDYGLMQLHGIDILDPAQNISYAYYHKYLTQGWAAWSTYNSGKYRLYL